MSLKYLIFTPNSDQSQTAPIASPEILHHIVWTTWLFIHVAYSDERWLYYHFSLPHLYIIFSLGWENVLVELGMKVLIQGPNKAKIEQTLNLSS